MSNPSMRDWECNKACKIDDLDIKNCPCKKWGKRGEDEILNTTETSLDDIKVICNCK